jgi:hypothetical protein
MTDAEILALLYPDKDHSKKLGQEPAVKAGKKEVKK